MVSRRELLHALYPDLSDEEILRAADPEHFEGVIQLGRKPLGVYRFATGNDFVFVQGMEVGSCRVLSRPELAAVHAFLAGGVS